MNNEGYMPPEEQNKVMNGFIWVIVRAFATSVTVFLRHNFGEAYLGPQAVAVLLIIPLFAGSFPGHDQVPILYFLGAYLCMCLYSRLCVLRRWWQGIRYHSQYSGTPWLLGVISTFSEPIVKTWIEPPLTILLGYCLLDWNDPLGSWIFYSGIALWIIELQSAWNSYQDLRGMRDSYLEQLYMNRRFRGSCI
jgi:hypothetical protein